MEKENCELWIVSPNTCAFKAEKFSSGQIVKMPLYQFGTYTFQRGSALRDIKTEALMLANSQTYMYRNMFKIFTELEFPFVFGKVMACTCISNGLKGRKLENFLSCW